MRMTIGPLSPAVYWRRRALVAIVLLALTLPLAVRCASEDEPQDRASDASTSPSLPSSSAVSTPPSVLSPSAPATGASSVSPTSSTAAPTTTEQALSGPTPVSGGGTSVECSDDDLTLTASVEPSPGVYGGTFSLSLTIVNVSGHSCSRDIGSGPQELRVEQGTTTVWSSDGCDSEEEADVRTFGVGAGVRFSAQWDSYKIAPDTCTRSSSPAAAGNYEVVARLGTKLSDGVTFEIKK